MLPYNIIIEKINIIKLINKIEIQSINIINFKFIELNLKTIHSNVTIKSK